MKLTLQRGEASFHRLGRSQRRRKGLGEGMLQKGSVAIAITICLISAAVVKARDRIASLTSVGSYANDDILVASWSVF
jgi:hypothetical protein